MLPELKTAIENMAAAVSGVSQAYYQEVPDSVIYPYVFFDGIGSGRNSHDGGTWRHEQNVQFTFRGDVKGNIEPLMSNFFDLQDSTSSLSVSGWSTHTLQTIFGAPDPQRFGDIYQGSIDFNIVLLKSK